VDDIDKDGGTHVYDWRLHTAATNAVNTASNPVVITGTGAVMNLHVLDPDFASLSVTTSAYNSGNTEPASTLIKVSRQAVNPRFTFLMIPRAAGMAAPAVDSQAFAWGIGATVDWGGGLHDVLVRNDSGSAQAYAGVTTDAALCAVRMQGAAVSGYLMASGRSLSIGGTSYASFGDGAGSCEVSDDTVHLDRFDADFRILDTGVDRVVYRAQNVGFVVDDGYVVPDGVTATGEPPVPVDLSIVARPNPFNPTTVIRVAGTGAERATVTIYDVTGRRVRGLWDGRAGAERSLVWDGRNDAGRAVASGAYFVRVATPSRAHTIKIVLVK
jgi:hypothetical protein